MEKLRVESFVEFAVWLCEARSEEVLFGQEQLAGEESSANPQRVLLAFVVCCLLNFERAIKLLYIEHKSLRTKVLAGTGSESDDFRLQAPLSLVHEIRFTSTNPLSVHLDEIIEASHLSRHRWRAILEQKIPESDSQSTGVERALMYDESAVVLQHNVSGKSL